MSTGLAGAAGVSIMLARVSIMLAEVPTGLAGVSTVRVATGSSRMLVDALS